MNTKGSPGGILLIAFGVLFIRLAYTGRISAVWKALITGEAGATEDLGDTGNTTGVPPCPKCPVADCTNAVKAADCKPPYQWCTCSGKSGCCKFDTIDKPLGNATDPIGGQAFYHAFNAAGAPYLTSAGNTP